MRAGLTGTPCFDNVTTINRDRYVEKIYILCLRSIAAWISTPAAGATRSPSANIQSPFKEKNAPIPLPRAEEPMISCTSICSSVPLRISSAMLVEPPRGSWDAVRDGKCASCVVRDDQRGVKGHKETRDVRGKENCREGREERRKGDAPPSQSSSPSSPSTATPTRNYSSASPTATFPASRSTAPTSLARRALFQVAQPQQRWTRSNRGGGNRGLR